MKKIIGLTLLLVSLAFSASAQKYAFVDSEYILKNIPAYESAQEQLEQASKKWQQEVEASMSEVKQLYKNYQTELVFLSDEMKVKKETEIVTKEKAAHELQKKFFGPEGELFKKRESLIKPIQDEVFNAVKDFAEDEGYAMILDKASSVNIMYVKSTLDVSDLILERLGYSK